jgi:hypothetical protein
LRKPGKHPLTKNGALDASNDQDVVAEWFGKPLARRQYRRD